MNASNFTPLSANKQNKKGKNTTFKIVGLISSFVLLVGVFAGYMMVKQGFNLQPRAATASRNLTLYGWNGRCFTILSSITWAARYQCPGRIGNYASGCQTKRTGSWGKSSMFTNGSSNVCITDGAEGPKDSNGCFTQQLDIDNGSAGSPEGFYSFDSCGSTPTNPKPTPTNVPLPTPTPTTVPTPTAIPTPTPTPIPNATPTPTVPPTPTVACVVPAAPANVRVSCPTCK